MWRRHSCLRSRRFGPRRLLCLPWLLALCAGALLGAPADLVVYQRDLHRKTFPDAAPAAGEEPRELRAWAARGETESLAFCLWSREALADVRITAGELRGPGGARLPASAVTLSLVEYAPIRLRSGGTEVHPLRLRPLPASLDLAAGRTQQLWITLKAPADARPGEYTGRIKVQAGQSASRQFALHLTVFPFALDPPSDPFFGIFLSPTYLPTLAELSDLKERGFDALLWFWGHYGLRAVNDGGRLRMDFAALDRFLDRVKEARLNGPIVLALGNDSVGHYERALAQAFGLALAPEVRGPRGRAPKVVGRLDDETLNRLFVEGLRQLVEHARGRGWPELVLLPYDEPTEQFMDEYRHRTALIRRHLPGVRIYGVTMNRLAWAEQVVDDSDILVANGDFPNIGRLAREKQRAFWTYGAIGARDSFGTARFRYGLAHWRHGSQGIWFWGYNWYQGDPYNEMDADRGDSEWAIVYPPRAGEGEVPIPTPAFEGMREAVDDVRYAATLARLLRQNPSPQAQKIQGELEQARREWLSLNEQQAVELVRLPADSRKPAHATPVNRMQAFRLQVAAWITQLQNPSAPRVRPGRSASGR